nr:hypothetical protein [Lysinibacillus timonensis]
MRFCINCGQQAVNNEKFCQNCGVQLPLIENEKVPQPTTSSSSQNQISTIKPEQNEQQRKSDHGVPPKEKKPLSLGKKIGIISVIVLLVLIVGAHLYIQTMVDPTRQYEGIVKHFEDENAEEFTNSFVFSKNTYVNAKAFYEYVDENDWLLDDLEVAVKEAKKEGKAEISNDFGEELITIRTEPYLFFYKKFTFKVSSVDVVAYNYWPNFEVNLKIGEDEAVALDKEKVNVGSYAPGIYDSTISYKDDYFKSELKEQVNIEGNEDNEYIIDVDLSANVVYLSSDIEDATVFVNGENTGKTASEIELIAAPLDGSVEIYAESTSDTGESVQSETLYLTPYDTHIIFAGVQEEIAKQDFYDWYANEAASMFESFRYDYMYAVNYGDFSYVEDYFIDDSQLKKDYEKFVVEHDDFGDYYYNFISNSVLDVQSLTSNSLTLDSSEIFEFYSEDDGTWNYDREKRYTFELVDGELKIANIADIKEVSKTKLD